MPASYLFPFYDVEAGGRMTERVGKIYGLAIG